ncbi:MAG: glycosyltransferase [Thermoleptolyngbya sp. C42_A2020_037]|nr:glycosyltransferase [Thermoleptolyngbya sp. C42_A2020_037]
MRCPKLNELLDPPKERTGWPWTVESPQLPDTMPDGKPWPKISIVTPSYQQGQFIEETIRTVLLQGYPNLEYIIMDGGSQDETVEIIRRYERFLTSWVSERDRGQSDAINKGWSASTGDILYWLNSDDLLLPGTLAKVAEAFNREEGTQIVSGVCSVTDSKLVEYRIKPPRDFDIEYFLMGELGPGQPAVFISRAVFEKVGPVDESLHYTMDREYWTRISYLCPGIKAVKLSDKLAISREWFDCKSVKNMGIAYQERLKILDKIYSQPDVPSNVRGLKRRAYGTTTWASACLLKDDKKCSEALRMMFAALRWNPLRVKSVPKFLLTL